MNTWSDPPSLHPSAGTHATRARCVSTERYETSSTKAVHPRLLLDVAQFGARLWAEIEPCPLWFFVSMELGPGTVDAVAITEAKMSGKVTVNKLPNLKHFHMLTLTQTARLALADWVVFAFYNIFSVVCLRQMQRRHSTLSAM